MLFVILLRLRCLGLPRTFVLFSTPFPFSLFLPPRASEPNEDGLPYAAELLEDGLPLALPPRNLALELVDSALSFLPGTIPNANPLLLAWLRFFCGGILLAATGHG